ncbi:addiction module antitoxin [Arsukibacterium ikkense]|uniref:Antitoxin ParD n=1 Tax=Arsukibacterium ikkense TaxID=336831 RepID=A0A0M2V4B5_9GAMM|nr:type II toxin-antitoxin system ParD family antitoxin [Arsukibacterium ikkense]KKO45682.1 addiction module antitoxin [Arsukibacterium ikkense]
MAAIRKTITLTEQQGEWVKTRIASGDFTNDSEYFRDLIRRDQARNEQLEAVRAALIEGEQSGISTRSADDILRAARKRLKADGTIPA